MLEWDSSIPPLDFSATKFSRISKTSRNEDNYFPCSNLPLIFKKGKTLICIMIHFIDTFSLFSLMFHLFPFKYFVNLIGVRRMVVVSTSVSDYFTPRDTAASATSLFFLFSERSRIVIQWLNERWVNVPRVVVATPVHLVPVSAVTVVQEIVINETFGRPWTGDERQIRLIYNIVSLLLNLWLVQLIARYMNRHVLCWHVKEKRKCLGLEIKHWKL